MFQATRLGIEAHELPEPVEEDAAALRVLVLIVAAFRVAEHLCVNELLNTAFAERQPVLTLA